MKTDFERYLYNPVVDKLVSITVGLIIIWLIIIIAQKFLISKIKDNDSRYRAKKFSNFLGYMLTIILLAVVYSDKLGKFMVVLGVASAGIAFALQEVIVSFAGWLAIMLGGLYKVADRIQLGGIKGDVMDIGVLRTSIMEIGEWVSGDLYNGRMVFVSNSFVFKGPVFNYSADFPYLWDEIKIPIQYGSKYELVTQILLDGGKAIAGDYSKVSKELWHDLQYKYRLEETQTEPMVSMIANENWVEYTLRYIVDYKKRRATKTELFTRILKEIDATKGEVQFPSTTFNLGEAPELKINLVN